MINRCGCNDVTSQPIEFIIPEYSTKLNITKHKLFETYENVSKLKKDVICDFLYILKQLECGIQPDLENIKYNIMKIDYNTILANINTVPKKERYLPAYIGSGKTISDITIESNKIITYGKRSINYNVTIVNDGDYVYFLFPVNTPLIEIYIGGLPAYTEQLENTTYNNVIYKVKRTEPQYAGINEITIKYTN